MNKWLSLLKVVVAIFLFRIGLLPRRYRKTVEMLLVRKETSKLWGHRKLVWNADGYWYVDPMPSDEELSKYYNNVYWLGRDDKHRMLRIRDVDHFILLKPLLAEYQRPIRILNFGAGHGGISFLFTAMGCEVVNVEPSDMDLEMGWVHVRELTSVEGEFDLIYGSHSLEHVPDVRNFISRINAMLRPNGMVFFEVPNCHQSNREGYPNGKIAPPHTYYFTRDYFRKLDFETLLNKTFYQGVGRGGADVSSSEDDGGVIRYIGRKR